VALELHGYRYSVYVRIAAMTLLEKGLSWTHVEVDPFAGPPADYLKIHPFGRVPALVHDGFVLYETAAITRYLDEAFPGTSLQPADARRRARMNQIIAIVDAYAYWPMVRQVFAQRVFAPALGQRPDEAIVAEGLGGSARALAALDALAEAGPFLTGETPSLADLHLGGMAAFFTMAEEGRAELSRHARLSAWWSAFSARPSLIASDAGLPPQ
jgi:glutathione S-transferase